VAFKTIDDPRLVPAYSVAEAAHYLRMPEETLRSWLVGRLYPVAGQTKRSRPLVHLDDRVLRVENFRSMFPEPNHIFNACLLAGKIDANVPPACTNAWFF